MLKNYTSQSEIPHEFDRIKLLKTSFFPLLKGKTTRADQICSMRVIILI